ncbi:MAG: hypothetical protein J5632_00180 [Bacteroidales bacterium]|nr:hypothetical protein [Bacteroidales bacterium]
MKYDESSYEARILALFSRFQSVQSVGFTPGAYKPGLDGMRHFGEVLSGRAAADGCCAPPWESYPCIHVAGTNGKGSVASMLASALASGGRRVGLYTSPHLLDFRERMKVVTADGWTMPSKEWVWDFLERYEKSFDAEAAARPVGSSPFGLTPPSTSVDGPPATEPRVLRPSRTTAASAGLTFFEITTGMAFKWFEEQGVDAAVIEAGLGGRLDSTNVITPALSVITSIGLDHCAILGSTRAAIAGEKAGIFKPGVPALVWGHDDETDSVFREASEQVGCPLYFADDILAASSTAKDSPLHPDNILPKMDLQGPCQRINVRTVLAALEILASPVNREAICRTAERTGLRGRWERVVRGGTEFIFDIGHNPAALAINFARLDELRRPIGHAKGQDAGQLAERPLNIVYGIMADKDLDAIAPLMPAGATYWLVAPDSPRSLPAADLRRRLQALRPDLDCRIAGNGSVALALKTLIHSKLSNSFYPENGTEEINQTPDNQQLSRQAPIVYVGGSTFVVSEALKCFE